MGLKLGQEMPQSIQGRVHNIILITVTRVDRERVMEAREVLLLIGMGIQRVVVAWSMDLPQVLSCPDQVAEEESRINLLAKLEDREEV